MISSGGHLPANTMSMLIKTNKINFILNRIKARNLIRKLESLKRNFIIRTKVFEINKLVNLVFL